MGSSNSTESPPPEPSTDCEEAAAISDECAKKLQLEATRNLRISSTVKKYYKVLERVAMGSSNSTESPQPEPSADSEGAAAAIKKFHKERLRFVMGSSNSTESPQPEPSADCEEVAAVVNEKAISDENAKKLKLELDSQLSLLKKEVETVVPLIQDNVIETTHKIQDALIVRYSQLDDRMKIKKNIEEVLLAKDFPGSHIIVDTASSMITALNSTSEMKDIARWYQRKTTKRVGDKVIGIECHYKVDITEKDVSSGMISFSSKKKETVCLIAYKFLAHTLKRNPEAFLDDTEAKKHLTF